MATRTAPVQPVHGEAVQRAGGSPRAGIAWIALPIIDSGAQEGTPDDLCFGRRAAGRVMCNAGDLRPSRFGSRASVSPSPMRFTPGTVRNMASTGWVTAHHASGTKSRWARIVGPANGVGIAEPEEGQPWLEHEGAVAGERGDERRRCAGRSTPSPEQVRGDSAPEIINLLNYSRYLINQ